MKIPVSRPRATAVPIYNWVITSSDSILEDSRGNDKCSWYTIVERVFERIRRDSLRRGNL